MRALLLLVLLVGAVPASAAPSRSLVLLFTGDNGGEVAPCG
jgi:hypothetical protein